MHQLFPARLSKQLLKLVLHQLEHQCTPAKTRVASQKLAYIMQQMQWSARGSFLHRNHAATAEQTRRAWCSPAGPAMIGKSEQSAAL
jgi:hypothetical protein